MFYNENESLIVTEDIGSEETGNLIPEGSEVNFIKLVDNENDLAQSMIAFKYKDRVLVALEAKLRPKNMKKVEAAKVEFNKNMMRLNPRLRRYHYNLLFRYYFRVYYFVIDLLGGKK